MARIAKKPNHEYFIAAVQDALRVLETVADGPALGQRIVEIAELAGVTSDFARRALLTLEHRRYVRRNPNGGWTLGEAAAALTKKLK
jgi:DNA-binding IclR family transcriptional regulator